MPRLGERRARNAPWARLRRPPVRSRRTPARLRRAPLPPRRRRRAPRLRARVRARQPHARRLAGRAHRHAGARRARGRRPAATPSSCQPRLDLLAQRHGRRPRPLARGRQRRRRPATSSSRRAAPARRGSAARRRAATPPTAISTPRPPPATGYPVSPYYVVWTPPPGRGEPPQDRPVRVPPPALDEGSHMSYAIQWFSFATVALVGGAAFVRADRRRGTSA